MMCLLCEAQAGTAAAFTTSCHTLCAFGFSAPCQHHMARITQTKMNLVSHPGIQSNETKGSAVMWATQEKYASDPFFASNH